MGARLGCVFSNAFPLGSGVSARWVSPRVCSILPMNLYPPHASPDVCYLSTFKHVSTSDFQLIN